MNTSSDDRGLAGEDRDIGSRIETHNGRQYVSGLFRLRLDSDNCDK